MATSVGEIAVGDDEPDDGGDDDGGVCETDEVAGVVVPNPDVVVTAGFRPVVGGVVLVAGGWSRSVVGGIRSRPTGGFVGCFGCSRLVVGGSMTRPTGDVVGCLEFGCSGSVATGGFVVRLTGGTVVFCVSNVGNWFLIKFGKKWVKTGVRNPRYHQLS